jgi:hypothetical protein
MLVVHLRDLVCTRHTSNPQRERCTRGEFFVDRVIVGVGLKNEKKNGGTSGWINRELRTFGGRNSTEKIYFRQIVDMIRNLRRLGLVGSDSKLLTNCRRVKPK